MPYLAYPFSFFFSSRRRHTRLQGDWSSDVCSSDLKLWTTALLAHAGLPVPETVVCEHPDEAMAAFRALGDVIVKPLFGSMGLGMVRVSDEEMAFRVFRTLETLRSVYYLQRAIDHDG